MELVIIKSRGDQITSVTTLRKLGQFSPIDLILINPCFTDQKLARDHQSLYYPQKKFAIINPCFS